MVLMQPKEQTTTPLAYQPPSRLGLGKDRDETFL
jgi:hypothetical protein